MKYIKPYKIFEQKDNSELIKELEEYNIQNYTINDDGTIDVDGDVYLEGLYLDKIPFNFGKVNGDFNIKDNDIISLKGSPKEVRYNFFCAFNYLENLIGGPLEVGGNYSCNGNNLETLEGCAGDIGGSLICRTNKLTSLDCSSVIEKDIDCRHNNFTEEPEFFGICGGKIIWE